MLLSRPAKVQGIDAAALHRTWSEQAQEHGFDVEALDNALHHPSGLPGQADEQVVAEALRRVAEESATWIEADLARHVATLITPNDHGAAGTVERIDALAAQALDRCVELTPHRVYEAPCRRDGRPVTEAVTDRRLTTQAILDQEGAIQRWATSSVARTPIDRSDPQRAAADAIAGPARMVLVVGPAGTGKTTATAQGVAALRARGRPVIGLAPTGKAADVLATEAGCPTSTVASSFVLTERPRTTQWGPGSTVIVDEAGMVATADLAEIIGLAHRRQWRLVLVGDPAQLPAVGRGAVFAHLCDTLPHHRLESPRRFHQPWEADASLALRAGDPAVADIYAAYGRLSTAHPALVPDRVLDLLRRHEQAGQHVAITTTTAGTARRINRTIQASRPSHGPTAVLADGTRVRAGDVVATRRNDPTITTDRQQIVRNRQTWTTAAVTPTGDVYVEHPERGLAKLPAHYVRRHLELGWAVTGYGNQGDTVDVGIAVLEPTTSRAHAYVAMTRGRHADLGIVVDPAAGDAAAGFAAIVARSPTERSALGTAHDLAHQAGLPHPVAHPDARRPTASAWPLTDHEEGPGRFMLP